MTVKINETILSIPPYLSTTWHQIASLHTIDQVLFVTLFEGSTLQIPGLTPTEIDSIFNHHGAFLEKAENEEKNLPDLTDVARALGEFSLGSSVVRFGFSHMTEDQMTNLSLEHNQADADAPDLPQEIIEKIGMITKMINGNEDIALPEPHLGCNCFHCQISRGLNKTLEISTEKEEIVSDAELSFEEWSVSQLDHQLYAVAHKLNEGETYQVFLGEPIGCTCGHSGCEHILAVLKS
jgi:hypothetical protein